MYFWDLSLFYMFKNDHMKLKSVSVLFSQQAGRARAGTEEGIQLSASAAL